MKETVQNYGYLENFGLGEIIAFPIYFMLAYFIAYVYKNRKEKKNPHYRYFVTGLTIKIIGAFGFCVVYIFVYQGGDTIAYYESARAFANLFREDFTVYFQAIFSEIGLESFNLFTEETGYPWSYMFFEDKTNFLMKLISPIVLVCFNSYLLSSIVLSILSYIGIWKAYTILVYYYPMHYKPLFWCFVALPTTVFWASGILKDTVILSAVGIFLYCVFSIFELKKKRYRYYLYLFLSTLIILQIKSYVLIALVPGTILWIFGKKLLNKSLWVVVLVMLVGFAGIFTLAAFTGMGSFTNSLQELITEASVKQRDLKQAYYAGNSFDIGDYEPTIQGALSVSPKALYAGLFRPTLFDARNVQMLLSGVENAIVLALFLIVFVFRVKTVSIMLKKNPFLILCLSFSVLMAVLIGLSTSNFGALVRFKTVFESYFIASLFLFYKRAVVTKRSLPEEIVHDGKVLFQEVKAPA